MDRRHFLVGSTAIIAASAAWSTPADPIAEAIERLERRSGGRLGLAWHDLGSGRRFAWRADALFPMCSTFKLLLAGALLRAADRGRERLGRTIPITRADLLPNSPFAETRVGRGATALELSRAAIVDSDNAAANLLLPAIGGPEGLTRFARSLGDTVTRLDRNEPALGEAAAGDPRDTTSPAAMLADMEQLLLGSALSAGSRRRLIEWMLACRTGKARLRAGLPAGWRIGHKTGTGMNGTANDVAIVWPKAGRRPLLIAAYLTGATVSPALCDSILASVGHAVARATVNPAGGVRPRS